MNLFDPDEPIREDVTPEKEDNWTITAAFLVLGMYGALAVVFMFLTMT